MERELTFTQKEHRAGYSDEDAYFDKIDRELILQQRIEREEALQVKNAAVKRADTVLCRSAERSSRNSTSTIFVRNNAQNALLNFRV